MTLRLGLLLALSALLAYRGGLHAWQLVLGALLLGGAIWAGPRPTFSRGEAWCAAGACLLGALGLAGAWDPQAHVNAWALLMALGTVFVLARRQKHWDEQRALVWVAAVGMVMAVLFVGLGVLGGEAGHADSVGGFLLRPHLSARWIAPNQNLLAGAWAVPALLAALALLFQGRRWAWVVAGAAATAIVYAGSRGALLALLFGLAYFALRVGRQARLWAGIAAVGILMLGLVAFAPVSWLAQRVRIEQTPVHVEKDPQLVRRKEFWAHSLRASIEAPWLGRGLGSFPLVARGFDLPVPLIDKQPIARYRLTLEHAHNEWLTLAVEFGWPVTLGILLALAALGLSRWRQGAVSSSIAALEAGLVAGLVVSLVDMNLRSPGILVIYALIAAALLPRQGHDPSPNWQLSTFSLLGLLLAVGLWASRQPGPLGTGLAAVLQPLDARIQVERAQRGQSTWPWTPWCGRHQSEWLWQASAVEAKAGRFVEALALSAKATLARPYWAPGWHWLAQRSAELGRQADAQLQIERALMLEPNFSRVLAWQCDLKLKQGRRGEARELLKKINTIQSLRVQREEPDAYTLYIQAIESAWLERRNSELGLSTIAGPKT